MPKQSPGDLLHLFATAQHHTWSPRSKDEALWHQIRWLNTSQMISALCSSTWSKQLICAQAPALTARAVSCSAQSQYGSPRPNPCACHEQSGSIPPWKLLLFQTCWCMFSVWKLCHPVQTSVRRTQSYKFYLEFWQNLWGAIMQTAIPADPWVSFCYSAKVLNYMQV